MGNKRPLWLLQLEDLFERVRQMLVKSGFERIAAKLEPLAPPVTVSLISAAAAAGNGFELAFFGNLRTEISALRRAGAEKVHFTGLRESALILEPVPNSGVFMAENFRFFCAGVRSWF